MVTEEQLRKNIPKIFTYNFFRMFLVMMPVLVFLFQSHGLSMFEIYGLQTFFSVVCVILEVPSGYVADLFGRKWTLVLSSILWTISSLVFYWSESFGEFLIFEFLCAVSISLYSGTDMALIYDSHYALEKNKENSLVGLVGKKALYSRIGESLASLLGGALIVSSNKWPPLVNAITSFIPLFIAITLVEPPRSSMSKTQHKENLRYVFSALFKHSRLLTFIILNLAMNGGATLLAAWAFQPFWEHLGIPVPHFGLLWAITNLLIGLGSRSSGALQARFGAPVCLLVLGVFPFVGFFGMGVSTSFWGVLWGLCLIICRGLHPILYDALNVRVSSDMRATAISMANLGIRLCYCFLAMPLGYLMDHYGVPTALKSLSGVYLLIFVTVVVPLLLALSGQKDSFIQKTANTASEV